MDFLNQSLDKMWNEDFWLPKGITWKNLESTDSRTFGQAEDLIMAIPLTVAIFITRLFVENVIMKPIGRRLGVSDKKNCPPPGNSLLEKAYRSVSKNPTQEQIKGYSKQLDWSERKISNWFRKKNLAGRSSTLQKFSETGWRFLFYLTSFAYGIYVLHDQECVWNRDKCWSDFPNGHIMTKKLYWYYMLEIAFYTSTTATQFFDVKRKDFWEMFIHHIATIFLLTGSYVMNFTKMGSFIIIVHDSADFYLELAKMAKYADLKQSTNIAFGLFAVFFFVSRMFVLPVWIIPSVWSGGLPMFLPYSVMHHLFPLLLLLQCLHFYWGYHVAGAVYASLVKGKIDRDTRSDTEEEVGSDDDDACGDVIKKNGDSIPVGQKQNGNATRYRLQKNGKK